MTEPTTTPEGKKRTRKQSEFLALVCEKTEEQVWRVLARGYSVKSLKAALASNETEDFGGKRIAFVCVHQCSTPKVKMQREIRW